MGSKKSEKRSEKHKKKKKHRSKSSSSESSGSSGSTSAEEIKIKRKLKKKLKKLKRLKKKEKAEKKIKKEKKAEEVKLKDKKKEKKEEEAGPAPVANYDINVSLMEKSKALAPMTKEEWEKQQNVLKRVYDEETGRTRLVKGNGEIMEECVSRERHLAINKQATRGDGEYFQKVLSMQKN